MLPGLIDNHTHLSMPFGGTWSIDDYDTGTQAAAAGGTTCLVDFALQMHPAGCARRSRSGRGAPRAPRTSTTASTWRSRAPTTATIADMAAMVDEGVSTFKVFLAYKDVLMVDGRPVHLACSSSTRETGGLVMVHAENGWAIDLLVQPGAGRRQRPTRSTTRSRGRRCSRPRRPAARSGSPSTPGVPVFIVHVTCREAADEIIAARARGVPAFGETCLQYLLLTEDDLRRPDFEGARYVCSPPLRDDADQAVALGRARATTTCRSSRPTTARSTDEQKRLGLDDFSKIPNGLAGDPAPADDALGARRARRASLTPSRLVELTSSSVAKLFGLYPQKGTIAPGADADIVIFDPAARVRRLGTPTSFMHVDYDVFEGQRAPGSPRTTLSRGTVVYDDGRILTRPGHGRFVRRSDPRPLLTGRHSMRFGITVLPDPPYTRFVELMQLAEAARLRVRLDVRLAPALAGAVPVPDRRGARRPSGSSSACA